MRDSIEKELLSLAEAETGAEARWNRPRKRRISLRVDVEVVDWFKSKGPGYQTRINRILRKVMVEGRNRSRMAPTALSNWMHFGGVKTHTSQRARCVGHPAAIRRQNRRNVPPAVPGPHAPPPVSNSCVNRPTHSCRGFAWTHRNGSPIPC
jgi:hypothetical protein